MRPKCGPTAARMWPEYEILWPVINPWTFPVARAQPEPKPQAQNPARTMKKVARPSPMCCAASRSNTYHHETRRLKTFFLSICLSINKILLVRKSKSPHKGNTQHLAF